MMCCICSVYNVYCALRIAHCALLRLEAAKLWCGCVLLAFVIVIVYCCSKMERESCVLCSSCLGAVLFFNGNVEALFTPIAVIKDR